MNLNQSQEKTLRNALNHWGQVGLLDTKTVKALHKDIHVQPFDWKRLAQYSFWTSLACIVIALGALLADKAFMELLEKIFHASPVAKCSALTLVSLAIYTFGFHRRFKKPEKVFGNEAILFLGVLSTAGAIYQLGRALDLGEGHFSWLLLLSFGIYGVLGYVARSKLVWVFSLLSLGSWMGAETGYMSGWGSYYLGMNYPLRFVIFGAALTGVALMFERPPFFAYFSRSTLMMGLLYLFIAAWILSIWGNYGDWHSWRAVKQITLFRWSLGFGALSIASILHGLKCENTMTRGFGLTFLGINLYTRYFEYCWNHTHKAIFFTILALSLWGVGSYAEKIWHLGRKR